MDGYDKDNNLLFSNFPNSDTHRNIMVNKECDLGKLGDKKIKIGLGNVQSKENPSTFTLTSQITK